MRTTVHNLIILDKSGSMSSIENEAISGVNETIGAIKASEKKNPEQEQFITLVAFCGCEQRYIFNNVPAQEVRSISKDDYQPCCMTPLYDAVGNACIGMEALVRGEKFSSVSVTIITDGYENASHEFNNKTIVSLIERLKKQGWMFAYIGADHDVKSVAFSLKIDNVMEFQKDVEGTKRMFEEERRSRDRYYSKVHNAMVSAFACRSAEDISDDEISAINEECSSEYFENY